MVRSTRITNCKLSHYYIRILDKSPGVLSINKEFLRTLFEYIYIKSSCIFKEDTVLMYYKINDKLVEMVYRWV